MAKQFFRLGVHIFAIGGLLAGIVHWYDSIKIVFFGNRTTLEVFPRFLESDHEERIVGGVPVEPGEFPFFVYPVGMMLCGATLIYPE
jgi:hypothetical protein